MDEEVKEAFKFIEIARNCEGYKIFRQMLKVRFSYLIFLDNKIDLNRSLKVFKINHFTIYDSPTRLARRQRKLSKELYNLISSGQNLKEHLNKRNASYCNAISNTDLSLFFRELRNMLVHHDTFSLVSKRKIQQFENRTKIEVFQSMDKSSFTEHLMSRKNELITNGKNKKGLDQMERLLLYVGSLSEGFYFEDMLVDYCNSIEHFRQLWMSKFIHDNFNKLLDFYVKLLPGHKRISTLPVNLVQARYLRFLLAEVSK